MEIYVKKMKDNEKKKFRLIDAILAAVCITLVVEAVVPTASIGNTQYFWWLFLIIFFCIPYGLISSELGSTYPSEGGMYTWVKKAFGPKWASRVAWNYWINFPLWIASLAILASELILILFNVSLGVFPLLLIQIGFVLIVTILGSFRVGESKWLINIGTMCKILSMLGLGFLGIYSYYKTGVSANPITGFSDLLPEMNFTSLSFLSVIIFNFLGLEVVATFANDMKQPEKEIPKAIMIGGILIAFFYLLPATGLNIALDLNSSSSVSVPEAYGILLSNLNSSELIVNAGMKITSVMLILTLFANITSWSFGVNSVAKYSADDNGLPKLFKITNENGVPYITSMLNGLIAIVVIILGTVLSLYSSEVEDLFWTFFSLSLVTLLLSYIPLFLSFKKLRECDNVNRAYKVPGNNFTLTCLTYIPLVIIVISIAFTVFIDFTKVSLLSNLPLIVGLIISIVLQEIVVNDIKEEKNENNRK